MDTTTAQAIEKKNFFEYWLKITFKTRMARFFIYLKNKRKRLFQVKFPVIDSKQRSVIDLFCSLIKNKDSNMNYSPESKTRYIETESAWITMRTSGDRAYLINIINESSNKPRSHEVYIPAEYADIIIDEFDLELEKRFRMLEDAKTKVIVDDLEDLIRIIKEESDVNI